MKVLVFAATNHKDSINRKLLTYVLSVFQNDFTPDAEIEFLDLIDYELPLYRQDRQAKGGIPVLAQEFYKKIGFADALIIAFAEHNGSFSAVYKNLFDWMSRINQKVYQNKPMIVMAATPGERGGKGVLGTVKMTASFFGMDVKAMISVPMFYDNFDIETMKITNEDIEKQIQDALVSLM